MDLTKAPLFLIVLLALAMGGIEHLLQWSSAAHLWLIEGPLSSVFGWLF